MDCQMSEIDFAAEAQKVLDDAECAAQLDIVDQVLRESLGLNIESALRSIAQRVQENQEASIKKVLDETRELDMQILREVYADKRDELIRADERQQQARLNAIRGQLHHG